MIGGKYGGFLVKHPEKAILKYKGYIIPSSMISKKPFKVKLNIENPLDDKEIERVSKIIIEELI
ncbi:unnamed protein product [marine sediment metagenome]|uniref:Uncharacterized protein n=1 Tax=marine sediment metagenome TaxID=412755 RepID=X0YSX9_9ZZZZ